MDGPKAGIAAALATAGDPRGAAPAEAEQLDLVDAHGLETGHSPLDTIAEALRPPAGNRGKGRPKGAANRQTQAFARLFLAKHRSPLDVLADIYQAPTVELARKLTADPVDVLRIQMHAAAAVAPYVHRRMPLEVANVGERPLFAVNIGAPPGQAVDPKGQSGVLIEAVARAVGPREVGMPLETPDGSTGYDDGPGDAASSGGDG